ncbi:MAG: hypothetical protein K8R16_11225 [Anaerolineales bacterium]|nr:hypothetical protein [Anaerolineales bacterium]
MRQVRPRLGLTLSEEVYEGLLHICMLKAFNESCIHLSCLADAAGIE